MQAPIRGAAARELPLMHPYRDLGARAFWPLAVAQRPASAIDDLHRPRFAIPSDAPIATFGNCFSMNLGPALATAGFAWVQAEPAPAACSPALAARNGYGAYSARTGHLDTPSLVGQWARWATDESTLPAEVWRTPEGSYLDPFRPTIEPGGFASADAVVQSRRTAARAFRRAVTDASVLVLTLTTNESFVDATTGVEYPIFPGHVGPFFRDGEHLFVDRRHDRLRDDLRATVAALRTLNPSLRLVLAVSAIPLKATATPAHVLVASGRAKAMLRSVVAEVADDDAAVDYFPSYEIATSPQFEVPIYQANKRTPTPATVARMLSVFFAAYRGAPARPAAPRTERDPSMESSPTDDSPSAPDGSTSATHIPTSCTRRTARST